MATTFSKSRRTKLLFQLLGFSVGLGVFLLALCSVQLPSLGRALGASLNGSLLLCILAWISSILFQVWRWQIMLNARKPVPFNAALKLYVMNRLTNLLFVFRAGEGVRVLAASRTFQIDAPYLIASIVNERLLNAVFLALITLGLTLTLPWLVPYRLWLVAGLFGLLLSWSLLRRKATLVPRSWNASQSGFRGFFAKFGAGISILRDVSIFRGVLLTSLGSWASLWFGIWILQKNLVMSDPWLSALAVLLLINVAGILPLTPSSVGPFQWACILALSHFGIGKTEAVAFSLVLQGVRIVAALLAGTGAILVGVFSAKGRADFPNLQTPVTQKSAQETKKKQPEGFASNV